MESKTVLPKHVINTVIKTVFVQKYVNGKYLYLHEFEDFNVDKLIHIIEVLKQYYSLDENEEHALAHLYAWRDAKSLFDKIQNDYSALIGAFREISRSIDSLYNMERDREERRRYSNMERYNEKWERPGGQEHELQSIYKDVAYREIPFEKFRERVVQYQQPNSASGYSINIPSVSIDQEVFSVLNNSLNDQRSKVDAMTKTKNEAFSILKQYVYRIVHNEGITPTDNVE